MFGESMDVVNIDSENSDDEAAFSTKLRNITLIERPRLAKKSTATPAPEPKYGSLTKRQAALASKDKTKEIVKQSSDREYFEAESRRRGADKKVAKRVPGALYDCNGVHIHTNIDICDCQQESCKGCFFMCKKCLSYKCGLECRVNRKYMYESIEYHGYEFVIKNPLL